MARRLTPWDLASLGVTVSLAMIVAIPAHAQTTRLAAAVKATYLYKLAPFVEWPASDPAQPFRICVIGPDPFGAVLDEAVAGQAYGGRPFAVVRTPTLDTPSACDLVYAGGPPQQVATTLKTASGHPILTVTDSAKSAGMVDFTVHQGKVRFRIDQVTAEANGLTISSKLLSLALAVRSTKGRP